MAAATMCWLRTVHCWPVISVSVVVACLNSFCVTYTQVKQGMSQDDITTDPGWPLASIAADLRKA